MAIGPINVTRLTNNQQSNFLLHSLRRNQLDVFTQQTRIASGRSFATPSQDPASAARVVDLTQTIQRQDQFSTNLQLADNTLAAADSAMTDINSLLIQASAIASQNVSNLTSADERNSVAEIVGSIRQQLQTVGNREFNGRFLFAGRDTTNRPFVDALGGVAYIGDTGDLVTRVSEGANATINVPGNVLFGALSSRIASGVDLSPVLTASTRLDDLNGAAGHGVRKGTLVFNEVGGAGVFRVNLDAADTIGDIADLINQAASDAGAALTASVTDTGLTLTPGGNAVSVTDTSTGLVAADLGLLTSSPTTSPIVGRSLGARLTSLTAVGDLRQGAGMDLGSGLILTNGLTSVTVDLSGAQTVQDIINRINNAGVFVLARINDAGTGIDVFNQVSGTSLTIGENGGTTATDLGLRTFAADTPLKSLNFGSGVTTVAGEDDFRITAKDGGQVDVNLDGAVTVQDVIDRIDKAASQAGVNIAASLVDTGNGIQISDNTGGTGNLSAGILNQSTAALELGLIGSVSDPAADLVSADRSSVRTEGVLGSLIELESALRSDDTQGITAAAQRVERFAKDVSAVHGTVGARSQGMRTKLAQMQDASSATQVFLSQVQDLDFTEAVTKMQAATTQLQASLRTGSLLLNLSLLDFLQ